MVTKGAVSLAMANRHQSSPRSLSFTCDCVSHVAKLWWKQLFVKHEPPSQPTTNFHKAGKLEQVVNCDLFHFYEKILQESSAAVHHEEFFLSPTWNFEEAFIPDI